MLSRMRTLSALAVALMMVNEVQCINSFPNLREMMQGPNSNVYFAGTTEDIVSVVELFYDARFFFLKMDFY